MLYSSGGPANRMRSRRIFWYFIELAVNILLLNKAVLGSRVLFAILCTFCQSNYL